MLSVPKANQVMYFFINCVLQIHVKKTKFEEDKKEEKTKKEGKGKDCFLK